MTGSEGVRYAEVMVVKEGKKGSPYPQISEGYYQSFGTRPRSGSGSLGVRKKVLNKTLGGAPGDVS